jgi:hypothetical protein
MDILFPIASGLGLRLICINLPEPISRIAPAFIGLWEGTLSHLLILRNPDAAQISTDHFLAYGIRLLLDLVLSRDHLRPVAVVLWTGVGIFLCQAFDLGEPTQPSRKRSRRRRVSGSASLPSHVRVYEAPPPGSDSKAEGSISNHVSPRAELPHERPGTPPSFFLEGEDFELLNISSTPNRPPASIDPPSDQPSVIAPVAEAASAEDPQAVPSSLPTPPATSISGDVDKGTGDSGQRLSTIVEASSGEETTTLANAIEGKADKDPIDVPATDTASFESKEHEPAIFRTPTKADPLPLPVPDPLTRRSRQKTTAASRTSALADVGATADAVTTKILLRPYNDEEEVASDELQTPLNPVFRALLEEDVNNVLSENENDELQTPLRMGQSLVDGQLSPLSLPVRVRLTDPLARVAQGNIRYVESAERDLGLEQLTILDPPRRVATQSIDAVIEASNTHPRDSLLMASESALSSPMSETESSILSAAGPIDLYAHGDDWRKKARQEEKLFADLKTQYKTAVMNKRVKDAFILKGQINETAERIEKLHEKAAKRFYKGSRGVS